MRRRHGAAVQAVACVAVWSLLAGARTGTGPWGAAGEPPRSSYAAGEKMGAGAIRRHREQARGMWMRAYGFYQRAAFPADELDPIHCTGRGPDYAHPGNININDVLGNFSLTLIDSLDALAILGNVSEFHRAIQQVVDHVSFEQRGSTVQVFEANIRVLGGLLSAHLLAVHPGLGLRPDGYDDELLWLARDLGARLLPAFEGTKTGLPHPRVNLVNGVPRGGRTDTNTAACSTLLLEFGVLSALTDDPVFAAVARRSLVALFELRDRKTGLLGSNMDIQTGAWIDGTSSFGAGTDSLYEYLFKAHVLFGSQDYLAMFDALYYPAISRSKVRGLPIHANIHMQSGDIVNTWVDSLQAFLPGLQVMLGELPSAIINQAMHFAIWKKYGGLPERFSWQTQQPVLPVYPLRPELAESTYHLYRCTRDPEYLRMAAAMLRDIETYARVRCGYSTIHDVRLMTKEDRMESFFLSETLKYLFLTFDTDNPILHGPGRIHHVFTTQGHVLPALPVFQASAQDRGGLDGASRAQQQPTAPTPGPAPTTRPGPRPAKRLLTDLSDSGRRRCFRLSAKGLFFHLVFRASNVGLRQAVGSV